MPSILITGGSGFIGSSVAGFFRRAGWRTYSIGRRQLDQPDYFSCDLTRPLPKNVEAILGRVDVVVHAAARSSPWGTRSQFFLANVEATQNVLDACKRNGSPRFVLISSSSVYYRPHDQFAITESTPLADPPVNHYAHSKQHAEKRVEAYSGNWLIVRPRAVYGAGDTVLFPRIIQAARAGKLPLLVREGSPVRGDLISIDNLVACLYRAAREPHIQGHVNLTDNAPQEIIPFLLDVFDRLGIPRPQKTLSVKMAFRLARVIEGVYGLCLPWREPPITRFGVHVFAYSKTFDVDKMLNSFGAPAQTTDEAVNKFVSWVTNENPYRLG